MYIYIYPNWHKWVSELFKKLSLSKTKSKAFSIIPNKLMSGTTAATFERQVVSAYISHWLSGCSEIISKTGLIWWSSGTKYPSPPYLHNYFSISLFPAYSQKILITTFSIVNYMEGIPSNLYQIISVTEVSPQLTYPLQDFNLQSFLEPGPLI